MQTKPAARPTPRTASILVIDDDQAVRDAVTQLLESAGHRVITASCVAEAWERLNGVRPDLILSDLRMPGPNGAKFHSQVRGHEQLNDIPFVFLSGMYDQEDQPELNNTQDDSTYHLCKPVRRDVLLATVQTALATAPVHH